jgi:hypothetical protein
MATMSDERTPAGEQGAVSIRVGKDGWRAHVPTYLLVAIGVALNGGTCSRTDDVAARLGRLEVAVARLEGAQGPRVALHGAEGAGGTAALPDD